MIEKCARCVTDYPEDILSVVVGSMISEPVCGICAREMIAAIHGFPRYKFLEGTTAAEFEQLAIEYREKGTQHGSL